MEVERCLSYIRDCYTKSQKHEMDNGELCISPCQFHTALITDEDFVLKILQNLTPEESAFILTARIGYSIQREEIIRAGGVSFTRNELGITENTRRKLGERFCVKRYQLVSAMFAIGGNCDLMKILITYGLDIFQVDVDGNTILHLLVDLSDTHTTEAVDMYNALVEILCIDELKKLILMTNSKQETALDIALQRTLPEMMHAILNTEGIYRFHVAINGNNDYYYYDVTEFEMCRKRRCERLHPLYYISTVSEMKFQRMIKFGLLQKEPFKSWIEDLTMFAKPLSYIWFQSWSIMVIMYIFGLFYSVDDHNSKAGQKYTDIAILISASIAFSFEASAFMGTIHYLRHLFKNCFNGIFPLGLTIFYRLCQLYFIFSVIILHSLHLANVDKCYSFAVENVYLFWVIANLFHGILGLLFFSQLSSHIGHYLIIIEKMVIAILSFLIITALSTVTFGMGSHLVMRTEIICGAISNTTQCENPVIFSDFATTFYEVSVLISGVSFPPDPYFSISPNYYFFLIVLYVEALFFCFIIILNLAVAIMNQKVAEIWKNKEACVTVAQLAIYIFATDRLIMRRKFYKWITSENKRLMIHNEDKGKFYLRTVHYRTSQE